MLHNPDFRTLLEPIIRDYREKPHEYWHHCIATDADAITFGGCTNGGDEYQVEIQAFWDDHTKATIRVCFVIDDGSTTLINGSPVQFPYCEDFIIAPGGNFVGE